MLKFGVREVEDRGVFSYDTVVLFAGGVCVCGGCHDRGGVKG